MRFPPALVPFAFAIAACAPAPAQTSAPATAPTSAPASAATGIAAARVLDDFTARDAWRVIASDGVEADATIEMAPDGPALRLDFNFRTGGGFCVLRRELALDLTPNYRFSFEIRGAAPANNLEFKLVDPSGANVWWVNRRGLAFPRTWRTLEQKRRQFRFAWGPSGGAPLERLGAIEFAIAAGEGGRGSVWLRNLSLEVLPDPQPPAGPPRVTVSTRADGGPREFDLPPDGTLAWQCLPNDGQPWIELDLLAWQEIGGLTFEWSPGALDLEYEVHFADQEGRWLPATRIARSNGGLDPLPLAGAETRQLYIAFEPARHRQIELRRLWIEAPEFAENANTLFRTLAGRAPRGLFPRYYLDQLTPWTIVGVPGDEREALLDADGALEVDKAAFRIEPLIVLSAWADVAAESKPAHADPDAPTIASAPRLITWANAESSQRLAERYLPLPRVTWRAAGLRLEITALADGEPGRSTLLARYELRNETDRRQSGALLLLVSPFQVLPPWHDLNMTGGAAGLSRIIARQNHLALEPGQKEIWTWTPAAEMGPLYGPQIQRWLGAPPGLEPLLWGISTEEDGIAPCLRGALRYPFELEPDGLLTAIIAVPFHSDRRGAEPPAWAAPEDAFQTRYDGCCSFWRRRLNRTELILPASAARLADTFRTQQAHILINADGPAIQPGARTYERSWIRDGALTSTALLYTGQAELVREFIDWYAPHQYDNGKIPCVVDRRGPDPVPEHDSTGEFIYLVHKYYRFSRDQAFLEKHLPRIIAGVDYLAGLRAQRMTDDYRNGPPEKRACYGLVPESISHEGYSAQPMHSYWDSFFTLRGLADAAEIARVLGRGDLEQRFAGLRDDYRAALSASLALAIENSKIDYIPGCVELGDFDATSTAIALYPCGVGDVLPEPARTNTFERYLAFFGDRRDGRLDWENYTPYEIRIASALLILDQPAAAHRLLDFFLAQQTPPTWNQWAEVTWRDQRTPRFIGDMPHTWVGSEFIKAVRNLLVYERPADAALVLAAGVPARWALEDSGVVVKNFPTEYGTISYSLRGDGRAVRPRVFVTLQAEGDMPPGGYIVRNPLEQPITAVTLAGAVVDTYTAREVRLSKQTGDLVLELGH